PLLNVANGNPVLHPAGRSSLAEAVELPLLANIIGLASYLSPALMIVAPPGHCGPAAAAVQSCPQGQGLKLPQKMTFEFAALAYKNPAVVWAFFITFFERFYQVCGKRNDTALVILDSEADVFLAVNTNSPFVKIEVVPFCKHYLPFS